MPKEIGHALDQLQNAPSLLDPINYKDEADQCSESYTETTRKECKALPAKNAALQSIRNPAPKPAPFRNASREVLHKAAPNTRSLALHKRSHEVLSKPAVQKQVEKSAPFHKRSRDLIAKPNPMKIPAGQRSHEVIRKVDPHKLSNDTLYRPKVVPASAVVAPKPVVVKNQQREPPSSSNTKEFTNVNAGKSSVEAARAGEVFVSTLRTYPKASNKFKACVGKYHKSPKKHVDEELPTKVLSPRSYYLKHDRPGYASTPFKGNRPEDEPEIGRDGAPNPYRYGPLWLRELLPLPHSDRKDKMKEWSKEMPMEVWLFSSANFWEMHRLAGEGMSEHYVDLMMNVANHYTAVWIAEF